MLQVLVALKSVRGINPTVCVLPLITGSTVSGPSSTKKKKTGLPFICNVKKDSFNVVGEGVDAWV